MISNPRLTRRGHLPVRKLRHMHSGLHACHGPQPQQLARLKELINSVQHIEIHQPRHPQSLPPRPPGYVTRRIPHVVVRIERMIMCTNVFRPLRQLYRPLAHQLDQPFQSIQPLFCIETVKSLFQLCSLLIRHLSSAASILHPFTTDFYPPTCYNTA